MTNHWIDIKNSNVVIIMGGNAAEAHPVGFGWVTEAMQHNNAKLIVVDPRFNRSAALADHYAPIRSGTDIAFLLGVIRYLISTNQINFDYVKAYTNASYLVREDFEFHEGLFSGFDEEKGDYNKESWFYQLDEDGYAKVDESLEHPRCVWNLLKQHVERYDFATVSNITGTPVDDYQVVCEAIGSTYTKDRVATFMYALGWTHHSKGAQNIRTMAMVQLLLGNIGQLGGGVNALRGHANVQGSTDMGLLAQSLPGYVKLPNDNEPTLAAHLAAHTPKPLRPGQTNYWQNYPKFYVSLLKAFWGDNATPENDFGYDWLPKWDQMYDFGRYLDMMYRGQINGCIVQGVNAINSMPNRNKNLKALSKLKYLVVLDNLSSETATFWQNEPGFNEVDTASIQTEVFRLPTTCFAEEEGSIVNSGRWMQWHYKGANAPGEAMADSEIVAGILLELKKLYREEGGKLPEPVAAVNWEYTDAHNPSSVELTKELNGYDVNTGRQLSSFTELKADGSTACACWIYAGSWTEQGNQMARRDNHDPSGKGITPGWAFAWPANRRVLYNRASCDVNGKPWDPNRTIVEWKDGKWEGIDVPDFNAKLNPQDSAHPFIMQPEGAGRLFALKLLKEGPFPEHYEPVESPIGTNPLHPKVVHSPVLRWFEGVKETIGTKDEFPYACTTYSLTEHFNFWTTHCRLAAISMPETFVEMNEQLAAEKGIKNGDWVKVSSKRGHILTKALVTKRLRPLQVNGQTVHTLGIPRHGSHNALTKKAYSCNVLTTEMGDANTGVPEYKAFLVNVEKAEV
ncbi:formate dehydrogenase [Shewanella algae]|nr:formate dehydrogenase [Shewanella algae]TVL52283.1 formate dehydrogenase [Shewanella algae]TVO84127.1 formate dehydrogenase [Shewanella algae]TVO97915.1 formate dehydrogenase [Shewanella algae]TWO84988.1 formate dehydrogenase [Shewanella algae]